MSTIKTDKDVNSMTVAESLRRIRKQHKLTQQDIANVLGIDRTTYTLYENGVTSPSIENLAKLSSVYNATIGYIAGKEQSNNYDKVSSESAFVSEGNVDPVAYLPKEEQKLLISFRVLSDEDKESLIKEIQKKLRAPKE